MVTCGLPSIISLPLFMIAAFGGTILFCYLILAAVMWVQRWSDQRQADRDLSAEASKKRSLP